MVRFFAALVCCALLASCGQNKDQQSDATGGAEFVATSFAPMHFLAERLLDKDVELHCVTPPDVDPLGWKPSREIVADVLMKAKLIVLNGADAETWAKTVDLPASRVVDTTSALKDRLLEVTFAHTHEEEHEHDENCTHESHSHGDGEHEHTGKDPHTWVDPLFLRDQGRELAKAFIAAWPDKKTAIEGRLAALERDLEALDQSLTALLPRLKEHTLYGNHPAWSYWANRHGLEIEIHDAPTDRALDLDTLDHLLSHMKPGRPTLMLWEAEPVAETTKELLARGITPVVFSPAEDPAKGEDYLSVMKKNVERLQKATAARN